MTVAADRFSAGHDNKLTFDVSGISLDEQPTGEQRDTRIRWQWDVSF
jgi:hypothetical protein